MKDYCEENTSFFLIDFKLHDHSEQNVSNTSTLEWLKSKFRNLNIPFSYNFNNSISIGQLKINDTRYDAKISYRNDCVVGFTVDCCFIFDRKTKLLINSFEFRGVLVFALDDEHDEIYILGSKDFTDTDDGTGIVLFKYKLSDFIRKQATLPKPIYSKRDVCNNPFGLLLYNRENMRYLIAVDDFLTELKLIDCETGSLVDNTLLTVPENGYALELISNREIIIACSDVINIYEIDGKSFGLGKQALNLVLSKPLNEKVEIYSIVNDPLNGKLILSNIHNTSILVLNRNTLEIIQTQKIDDAISGICLDKQTGELFLCCEKKGLTVFH